jgi:hypothetical protein
MPFYMITFGRRERFFRTGTTPVHMIIFGADDQLWSR